VRFGGLVQRFTRKTKCPHCNRRLAFFPAPTECGHCGRQIYASTDRRRRY
jgi:ribosomal protein S27E